MKIPTALVLALILVSFAPANAKLKANKSVKSDLWVEYKGKSFFDQFAFWDWGDPTHGYVNYVNEADARSQGLISVNDKGQVLMKPDTTSVATGPGRNSVRIQSKKRFNSGLFIFDLEHVPTGCGTWPAFWLFGPNWPIQGEIDIIEVVNNGDANAATCHTGASCGMSYVDTASFTGKWATNQAGRSNTNCDIYAPGQQVNQGCGIGQPPGTIGTPFNAQGGGVYAVNWNPDTGIEMWSFPRKAIPQDILNGNPNVAGWGKPFANFKLGWECPNYMFRDHQIIINLTFCGDWAGSLFGQMCPGLGSCQDYVRLNPQAFTEAYWLINYLRVYSPQ